MIAGSIHGPLPEADAALLHLLEPGRNQQIRLFTHATAETQAAIHDSLLRESLARGQNSPGRQDASTLGREDPGFLEVFPRVASRPPKLLQELEAMLTDRLRSNDKAASSTTAISKDRDAKLSSNLSLDAHRQVLKAFIAGFASYAPLLTRIQEKFERCLDEGVQCAQENVYMRLKMVENEKQRQEAVAAARGSILAGEQEYRKTAHQQLQGLREAATRATKRLAAAERDLLEARAEEARLRQQVAVLEAATQKLEGLVEAESAWMQKPVAANLSTICVGPLSKADEDFLEQEIGISAAAAAPSVTSSPTRLSMAGAEQTLHDAKRTPGHETEGKEQGVGAADIGPDLPPCGIYESDSIPPTPELEASAFSEGDDS